MIGPSRFEVEFLVVHGDRYRVYRSPEGPAPLWYAVWDDSTAADRFLRRAAPGMRVSGRPGYRASIERIELARRRGTRYGLAPDAWPLWKKLTVPTANGAPR